MSRETDKIKQELKRYVDTMKSMNKTPSALYVTRQQWDALQAEAKHVGNDWRPRLFGIEVKKK